MTLFTRIGEILRDADAGSELQLFIKDAGEEKLDVNVILKDKSGEKKSSFVVSGNGEALDKDFATVIREPLAETPAQAVQKMGEDIQNVIAEKKAREDAKQKEKEEAALRAKEVPRETFARLWKTGVACKQANDWWGARQAFSDALNFADTEERKTGAENQLSLCKEHLFD